MSAELLQKQLSEEVAKFNQLQNDMQKVVRMRQQLEGQLTENTIVKEVMLNHVQDTGHDHVSLNVSVIGTGSSG